MEQRDNWRLTDLVDHEMGRGDPFAAAIRGTRMPMVITNPRLPDNPIVFANEAFQKLTGYGLDEIIGRNCRFLQGPDSDAETVAEIREAIENEQSIQTDLLNYCRDGSTFWNALYVSPVRGADGGVQFFFASQLDVTDRINQQERIEAEVNARTAELERALEAKTVLLTEVDHRVKNNLTMIGSLLRLQASSLSDPAPRATLGSMLERVDALAAVHRRLYETEDLKRFDIGAFSLELTADILGAGGRSDITLASDVEPVDIASEKAAPFGLILNELVINALKHAYPDGRSGTLQLKARREDDTAVIELQDDGPGFNGADHEKSTVGRALVMRLSRQVKGETLWENASPGARVTIRLPAAPLRDLPTGDAP